jgi:hypothetical protein
MATIRLCDWTKERLAKDEEAQTVTIGEHEFEVGEAGLKALLKQLEGEEAPGQPEVQVIEKIVEREAPPPPLQAAAPGGLDIEVSGDPFTPGPSSMPQPPMGGGEPPVTTTAAASPASDDGVPPIEIPADTRKKFKMPTSAQADKVIADSTVFEEGSLPSLTMGGKKQKEAMKKLRAIEAQKEKDLQRSARGGVRVNTDIRDKPGYYD